LLGFSGADDANLWHLPRLLSDNSPCCYVSKARGQYLEAKGIAHTQGKIERYHRSMKNISPLENYYSPCELEDQVWLFVDYYNHYRYHEALSNGSALDPINGYFGRDREILTNREQIAKSTLRLRKKKCALSLE